MKTVRALAFRLLSWLAKLFAALPAPAVPVPPETLDVLPFDPGQMVERVCFNGPCQGSTVHAPMDATPGTACALQWHTPAKQARFAVYMLVDLHGTTGLMYVKSYQKPEYAQAKVHRLTAICAAEMV